MTFNWERRADFIKRLALMLTVLGALSPQSGAASPVLPALVLVPGAETPTLLGVWDGARWLQGPPAARRVTAGTLYSVRGLTGTPVPATGQAAVSLGAPCPDSYGVALAPARTSASFELATRAGLKARPRPVTALPTGDLNYRELVRGELLSRGLKHPDVRLTGVSRVDLDGDGRDEVIVEATRYSGQGSRDLYPPVGGQVGDYSLLLLRAVVGGQVRTTALGSSVSLRPPTEGDFNGGQLASRFALAGVADLNGDGQMELIVFSAYYEGDGLTALTWTPAGGLRKVLETGCGA